MPLTTSTKALFKSNISGYQLNPISIDPDHFKVNVCALDKATSYENVQKIDHFIQTVFEQYLDLYVSNGYQLLDSTIFPLVEHLDFKQTLCIEVDLLETKSPIIFIEAYVYDPFGILVAKGSQKVLTSMIE